MSTIKDTLLQLKLKVDEAFALRQTPDQPYDLEHYHREILPHLLALRGINRREKLELEARCQKKKELYQRLTAIEQQCECLEFEAACLNSDVENIRQEMPDECTVRNGLDIDHATRMQLLDVEEAKRRELQKKLTELTEETKEIESSCSKRAEQLNQVKPYIRQLLEKVPVK